MNPVIRSDGSPKFAMISTLAGAVVNIMLDPVFIFVFRWGMMGAAAATVLGQILTAALSVWYLCHMKAAKLEAESFRIHPQLAGKYLALGVTSFLSQISLAAAMAAINNMIQTYGALDPVFGVGFALLLSRFFGLDGVLYSMPVSDILTFLIAAAIIVRTYQKLAPSGQKGQ